MIHGRFKVLTRHKRMYACLTEAATQQFILLHGRLIEKLVETVHRIRAVDMVGMRCTKT
jgi:hypothetical protein